MFITDEYTKAQKSAFKSSEPKEPTPKQEQPENPMPVPFTLPNDRCSSLKEMVAELKDSNKDCACTPDMFLTEDAAFVQRFDR